LRTAGEPRNPIKPRVTPLAEWLTQLRLEQGLCAHEVAARLGVNPGRVSECETGQREPKPAFLLELLKLYQKLPSD
jgi:transcriptional regulator with XRE-family HTH domain